MKTLIIFFYLCITIAAQEIPDSTQEQTRFPYSGHTVFIHKLLNIEIDTLKVITLKFINIEMILPKRRELGYSDFLCKNVNLVSYVILYRIGKRENWQRRVNFWTYKYYNLDWTEVEEDPIFVLDYEKFKPEIIRNGKIEKIKF